MWILSQSVESTTQIRVFGMWDLSPKRLNHYVIRVSLKSRPTYDRKLANSERSKRYLFLVFLPSVNWLENISDLLLTRHSNRLDFG